jgi:hypothetical protein
VNFNDVLRQIVSLSPEAAKATTNRSSRANHPEQYKQFQLYLKSNPAAPLEAMGYEYWLKRLGPHTFTRPFAPIQHKFWEWNWNALQKVLDNEPLEDKEKIGFLPWPRETGQELEYRVGVHCRRCIVKDRATLSISPENSVRRSITSPPSVIASSQKRSQNCTRGLAIPNSALTKTNSGGDKSF